MARILIFHKDADNYKKILHERNNSLDIISTSDEGIFRSALPFSEIVVAMNFPVDTLTTASQLRWLQIISSGVEFLVPVKAQIKHLKVTNGRGIHSQPIADYVMSAMTMLAFDFPSFMQQQNTRTWIRRSVVPLASRTVGIIGLGMIGQEIAKRAYYSDMNVIGLTRSSTSIDFVKTIYHANQIEFFLKELDFLVIATPATPENFNLIGAHELACLKPSAFLINIARGSLVNELALISALKDKQIAGACLDVFAHEPLPMESPLWDLPNVIITPHIAGMRFDYSEKFADLFFENLRRYDSGEDLINTVDFQRGY